MAETKSSVDGLQGVFALVGITLGLIPLVRVVLGGEVGRLLSWAPGTDADPGRWLVPLAIGLVCVAAIAVLERSKP